MFRGARLLPSVVMLAGLWLVADAASGADTAQTVTWPGGFAPMNSIDTSSGYVCLMGRFAETLPLVSIADEEVAPSTKTEKPISDNTVGSSALQAGQTTVTITTSIHAGHVSADMVVVSDVAYTKASDGQALGSQHSTGSAHYDVSPCPEPSGVAGGHISFRFRQDTTFPDGSRSSSTASAEGPVRIINGDDAHRVRTEVDLQVTNDSLHTPPPGSGTDPVGWGLTGPLNYALDANDHGSVGEVDESQAKGSGQFSHDDVAHNPATTSVQGFLLQLEPEVEKFWRSGKCIKLKLNEQSRKVDPQEKISLKVEAEHKIDHKEVKTPIKAKLTGVKSIDPKDKPVDEPAKFDYVAGGMRGDQGFIEVTQTGKRGIGKESLTFTVEARDLLFSLTETIRRPGNNGDRLLLFSLPSTPLILQEDGSYLGTGPLAIKLDFHEWRTHAVGNGVNQLTIVARPSESDPKRFYVTTSLAATPFTVTQTHTNMSIGTLTYDHLEDENVWSNTFTLDLDKVDRFQGRPGTIERLLREDPEKR